MVIYGYETHEYTDKKLCSLDLRLSEMNFSHYLESAYKWHKVEDITGCAYYLGVYAAYLENTHDRTQYESDRLDEMQKALFAVQNEY